MGSDPKPKKVFQKHGLEVEGLWYSNTVIMFNKGVKLLGYFKNVTKSQNSQNGVNRFRFNQSPDEKN